MTCTPRGCASHQRGSRQECRPHREAGAWLVQTLAEDQLCQKPKCHKAVTVVLLSNNDSKIMEKL